MHQAWQHHMTAAVNYICMDPRDTQRQDASQNPRGTRMSVPVDDPVRRNVSEDGKTSSNQGSGQFGRFDVNSLNVQDILEAMYGSYIDTSYKSPWRVDSIVSVYTQRMVHEYREKLQEMEQHLRLIPDEYLMFRYTASVEALRNIADQGFYVPSVSHDLGDCMKGVSLSLHADVELKMADQVLSHTCLMIVFRVKLGNCRLIADSEVHEERVAPNPIYNCHRFAVGPSTSQSISEQVARSQVYFFDFNGAQLTSSRPRQIIPIYVIKFRKGDSSGLSPATIPPELSPRASVRPASVGLQQDQATQQNVKTLEAIKLGVSCATMAGLEEMPVIQSSYQYTMLNPYANNSYFLNQYDPVAIQSALQYQQRCVAIQSGLQNQYHRVANQSGLQHQQYRVAVQSRPQNQRHPVASQSELQNQQYQVAVQSGLQNQHHPVASQSGLQNQQYPVAVQSGIQNQHHPVANQSGLQNQHHPVASQSELQNQQYPVAVQSGIQNQHHPVANQSGLQNQHHPVASQSGLQNQQYPVAVQSGIQNQHHPVANQSGLQNQHHPVASQSELQNQQYPVAVQSGIQNQHHPVANQSGLQNQHHPVASQSELQNQQYPVAVQSGIQNQHHPVASQSGLHNQQYPVGIQSVPRHQQYTVVVQSGLHNQHHPVAIQSVPRHQQYPVAVQSGLQNQQHPMAVQSVLRHQQNPVAVRSGLQNQHHPVVIQSGLQNQQHPLAIQSRLQVTNQGQQNMQNTVGNQSRQQNMHSPTVGQAGVQNMWTPGEGPQQNTVANQLGFLDQQNHVGIPPGLQNMLRTVDNRSGLQHMPMITMAQRGLQNFLAMQSASAVRQAQGTGFVPGQMSGQVTGQMSGQSASHCLIDLKSKIQHRRPAVQNMPGSQPSVPRERNALVPQETHQTQKVRRRRRTNTKLPYAAPVHQATELCQSKTNLPPTLPSVQPHLANSTVYTSAPCRGGQQAGISTVAATPQVTLSNGLGVRLLTVIPPSEIESEIVVPHNGRIQPIIIQPMSDIMPSFLRATPPGIQPDSASVSCNVETLPVVSCIHSRKQNLVLRNMTDSEDVTQVTETSASVLTSLSVPVSSEQLVANMSPEMSVFLTGSEDLTQVMGTSTSVSTSLSVSVSSEPPVTHMPPEMSVSSTGSEDLTQVMGTSTSGSTSLSLSLSSEPPVINMGTSASVSTSLSVAPEPLTINMSLEQSLSSATSSQGTDATWFSGAIIGTVSEIIPGDDIKQSSGEVLDGAHEDVAAFADSNSLDDTLEYVHYDIDSGVEILPAPGSEDAQGTAPHAGSRTDDKSKDVSRIYDNEDGSVEVIIEQRVNSVSSDGVGICCGDDSLSCIHEPCNDKANWKRFLTDKRFQPVVMLDRLSSVPRRPASTTHSAVEVAAVEKTGGEMCRTTETQKETTDSAEDSACHSSASGAQTENASKCPVPMNTCLDGTGFTENTADDVCSTDTIDSPWSYVPQDKTSHCHSYTEIIDLTCSIAAQKKTAHVPKASLKNFPADWRHSHNFDGHGIAVRLLPASKTAPPNPDG
ncbi:hypothetical protein LSAT2_019226 [Lamellibrachia satsuma]|nr:hypothetical protein LSAT2_019226 [Lamellibrachia satsuma]